MTLEQTRENWQRFGELDPLWAIVTEDSKRGNQWDIDEFFRTGQQVVQHALDYARSSGATVRFGRALDFGCGVGRLTQALAGRFASVVGVDVAESMVTRAREFNKFPQTCSYVVNTDDHLRQFPDASFDFILTVIVLQHIEPVYSLKYMAEFVRLLKPGGVLVFQQTASLRWWGRYQHPPASLRQRVARAIPLPLLNAYIITRGRMKGEPRMDAYGIDSAKVVRLMESHGAKVLNVTPDDWGGPSWLSNHYCVVKPDASTPTAY